MDPKLGRIRLSGRFCPGTGNTLLIAVHGLGGSSQSAYVVALANAAQELGWATLRFNQRGADLRGEDYYHAGLYGDLAAVLDSPTLAGFEHVYVVGFSLGGHTCLRLAASAAAPRVKAVAAISAPVDLAHSARFFDEHSPNVYRRHVLTSLVEIYERVAQRRSGPIAVEEARAIRFIRDWDERIVAPRHGFASGQDYYAHESASRYLPQIGVPTLVVHAERDPMVSVEGVLPALQNAPPAVTLIVRPHGGHLGFPNDLDLGQGGRLGIEHQVVQWLAQQS